MRYTSLLLMLVLPTAMKAQSTGTYRVTHTMNSAGPEDGTMSYPIRRVIVSTSPDKLV